MFQEEAYITLAALIHARYCKNKIQMKMNRKEYVLFILTFFLVFILQFELVTASLATRPRYYESEVTEEVLPEAVQPLEVPETIREAQTASQWILSQFFILVFQFFGIVILLIILIILLQVITESV
jgi:uncharacterized membrane protein YhaH (DUF805 family)